LKRKDARYYDNEKGEGRPFFPPHLADQEYDIEREIEVQWEKRERNG